MSKKKLLDLAPDQLKLVEDILAQHAPGKTVWAYGSRAKWSANQGSDLDLVAFDCTSREVNRLRSAFEESDLLASVDVMNWETIPENFKQNIKRHYVVVQEKAMLPNGWRKVALGNLIDEGFCVIKNTLREPINSIQRQSMQGEYPYYGAAKQIDFINRYKFEGFHLLIAEDGTVTSDGKKPMLQLVDGKFWVSNHSHVLQGKTKGETLMLHYMLSNIDIREYVTGAVQPKVTKENLLRIQVFLPPVSQQKRITEVLSSLDDKIDLLRRQNKTLEGMAEVLYRDWLAKGAKKHWKEGTLSDIAEIEVGERVAKDEPNYLEIGDIDTSSKDYDIAKKEKCTVSNAVKVPKNTLLISTVRPTRGAITITKGEVNVSGAFARIKCEDKLAYVIASRPEFFAYLGGISTGTTYPTCKTADILDYPVMVPPKKEMAKFNEAISPYFDKVMYNRLQMETLANMRDLLLPKLMNGTITV